MLALVAPPRIILCSSSPPSISTGDGRKYEISGGENESSIRWSSEPTTITSTSNPLVKHCVKLRQSSSYRHSCSSSLIVGLTPILEICRYQALKVDEPPLLDCLLLLDGADTPEGFNGLDNSVVRVSPNVMKKLSGMQSVDSTEGIAVVRMPTTFHDMDMEVNQEKEVPPSWFPFPHRILVLDGIQDPGNLGTLLRSALAFKWDGVFLLPGCCDPFNDKVSRAARGATFQIPLVSGKWFHLNSLRTRFRMKMLAGHPEEISYSEEEEEGPKRRRPCSLSGELADSLAGEPLCLVLGSEGNGLSEQAMLSCELVSIPMSGLFESLNVSVAGGIFLYMLQPKHHK